ncbi:neutral alpha-glucosidase C isoform X5 [Papio anubis]|uniref:neutral alpha-glucosidase C isoform X5 n=1 Tax=Papio anubis TaxID=9555 RepID=UPI000B7B911E|nr:neutral alpha-glucosidase C isoform X5 [Papio anubis]
MKLWIKTFSETATRSHFTGRKACYFNSEQVSRGKSTVNAWRQKQWLSKKSAYQALLDSVTTDEDSTRFQIINEASKVRCRDQSPATLDAFKGKETTVQEEPQDLSTRQHLAQKEAEEPDKQGQITWDISNVAPKTENFEDLLEQTPCSASLQGFTRDSTSNSFSKDAGISPSISVKLPLASSSEPNENEALPNQPPSQQMRHDCHLLASTVSAEMARKRQLIWKLARQSEAHLDRLIVLGEQVTLLAEIYGIEGNIFRLKINEETPLKPRFEVPDVLTSKPSTVRLISCSGDTGSLILADGKGGLKCHITANPFKVDLVSEEEVVISINSLGQLYFEHLQILHKQRAAKENEEEASVDTSQENQEDLGLWEEKFGKFVDIKANGPSSIGLDFSLHGFEHLYGIPQHAESHQLKNTGDEDAYRLYNLDVYGYQIYDKMGIYGSVPYLLAHKLGRTIGIFWLNASETLVEINTEPAVEYTLSQMGPVAAKQKVKSRTHVHWMSESGIIDVFLLTGPTPSDVFKQYSHLTGTQAMPPLFSLGYHQCRWNYEDEQDVKAVDAGFDEHDIPYDAMWLDIEHTEGKRYFTWDKKRFPNPKRMQELLRSKKRKLVVISDPHIKIDPDYSVYVKAKDQGFFVKNQEGEDFEGVCWPGLSSYLDFTNPKVREWYSSLFAFPVYQGSTDILFLWNDMNEPSVFRGPEQTMQKNAIHHGNWEHRELHNIYGFYHQMATAEGLIQRSKGKERPFVLTRSFFAGSQKYGAVWTGDNTAEWSYLKISIPMLLTLSITGISFCGADIGGFIGNPETELLVRWYQAGAYQPFFRGHATMNAKRREPWLFGKEHTRLIREAIRERYGLLPYWYSLFYHAHVASQPVMRPLWVEFPDELKTFDMEDEYMLGSALLVHPVTEPKATTVDVFLPGSNEVWYDYKTFAHWEGGCTVKIPVALDTIPVFQRGGSVVPIKTTVGKSTGWMTESSYGLRVALSTKGSSVGELYLDDGHSFQYLHQKQFLHRKFSFCSSVLINSSADQRGHYPSKCVVEQILVLGLRKEPSFVTTHSSDGKDQPVAFTYCAKTSSLSLEKLSLNIATDWEVRII